MLAKDCRKNPQIPNFMKTRPVGAELFHADRQTDRPKTLIIAFRNFRKCLKTARSVHTAVFMFFFFVWISEQTAIISLYNIKWLVFIAEKVCVYCAVRTECLNTVQVNFSLSVSAPPSPLFHTQLHLHVALKPEGQSAKLGTCKINALSESRDHWIETYRDLVVKCDKQTKSDHVTATSLHVTLLRTRHSTAQHSTAQHSTKYSRSH